MISNYIHTTFPSSPLSSFIHVSCLFGFRVCSMTNQKTPFFLSDRSASCKEKSQSFKPIDDSIKESIAS